MSGIDTVERMIIELKHSNIKERAKGIKDEITSIAENSKDNRVTDYGGLYIYTLMEQLGLLKCVDYYPCHDDSGLDIPIYELTEPALELYKESKNN